ncbi:MAG TPA: alkaline phosphatase family protein, partial [Chitinophagales bacterium]|nr:alkaline phosphatase family protein [Chitinophagales bacterium]
MRLFTSLLLALILFSTLNIEASQKRKVLFIGIDGTRADALQQAHTPYIDSLFASPGLSTYNAWCAGITISGPTWSSMLTGVWFNKHGVTNNNYTGSDFNTYPYFTTLAKQLKPNLYCAEVCEWPPLIDDVYNDNFNLRLHVPDGQGATTCATAATVLANDSIDFMFVYFDQVDLTGHSSGFSPTNPAYITAIENVDSCVGVVLDALHNRAHYADEDWLVILMTDHGGIGTGHGGNTDQERQIWWIASGNDLQNY